MQQSIQGRPPHTQDPRSADCRHSRAAFDCAFRVINERRDISPTAKLVHAHLVTLHRTGRWETQTEIGEALGLSRHQVWRALCELVEVGLIQVIRHGQGLPNTYVLLGIDQECLDGRSTRASGSRPVRRPHAGQPGTVRRDSYKEKKKGERTPEYTDTNKDYFETREGKLKGWHAQST